MREAGDVAVDAGRMLRRLGLKLAVAESCTGGMIGHCVTQAAGSSDYFLGGVIAYANAVKENVLNVPPETLREHGAVSEPTARAMAVGVRELLSADVGLSITGILGPSGGTEEKPVGLVFVGVAQVGGCEVRRFVHSGSRRAMKRQSCEAALEFLRRQLGQ